MLRNQLQRCLIILIAAGALSAVSANTAGPAKVASVPSPEHLNNSIGMKLIHIPVGNYLCYGRDIKPAYLFPKPKPGFNVKIERDFYIGGTEVTREQYQKIMGGGSSAALQFWRGIWSGANDAESGNRPANRVSWNDAVEFCRKLSELPAEKAAGRVYSLLTEREWQYAARAGSEYMFPYGSDDEMRAAEVAVCRDIYTGALPKGVQAVGTKKPNAWGLYDVLGNVWEWVQDACPADGNIGYATPSASAAAVAKGNNRIIVGGGWDNDFRMCNLAARYSAPPTRVANNIGFRVRCLVNGTGK